MTVTVLQYVAVRCSVLQCVAVRGSNSCLVDILKSQLHSHEMNALKCVAVRCSALQCVAVCCSVLQCVAVCCSESRLADILKSQF